MLVHLGWDEVRCGDDYAASVEQQDVEFLPLQAAELDDQSFGNVSGVTDHPARSGCRERNLARAVRALGPRDDAIADHAQR